MSTDTSKDALIASLRARVADLESENRRLQDQLAHARSIVLPALVPSMATSAPASARTAGENGMYTRGGGGAEAEILDDSKEAEGICSNCGKEIPPSSMKLHQLHCARNIKRCAGCRQPFAVKDVEQHEEETRGTPSRVMAAVITADIDKLRGFKQHGYDIQAICDERQGDQAIHVATRARQIAVMKYLLSSGVPVNAANTHGETPLHVACATATTTSTADGAPDALDMQVGGSPSQPRTMATSHDVISFLLTQGCDVDARNALGDTPLQLLQRTHNHELSVLLTSSGSSLRVSSRDSKTRPASASSLTRLATPTSRRNSFADLLATVDGKADDPSSGPSLPRATSFQGDPRETRPPVGPQGQAGTRPSSAIPPRPASARNLVPR